MNKVFAFLLIFILSYMSNPLTAQKEVVDLIIFNAMVYTVDEHFKHAEAFAVLKGRFVAVGSDEEVLSNYTSDRTIDAESRAVFPGFNDGHSHFLGFGNSLIRYADLNGTRSFDEVLSLLEVHADKYPFDWILGRGWDQNDWANTAFPSREKLDILFPDKPVVLIRIDGHAVLANSIALKLAGIDKLTKIEGGEVVLIDGEPSGVLIDNAADSMKALIPELTREQKIMALKQAESACLKVGLTTVSDAGLDKDDILLIDSLQQNEQLRIRVYAMLNPSMENIGYFFPKGPVRTDRLTVSSVKLYADGALGSRGALMLKAYADAPDNKGLQMQKDSFYQQICKLAYESGYQVNTHAIGDGGNRLMLKIYANILKSKNDKRWRIEHAQVVAPSDIHYFGAYSIIPSVQATHCTSDMYWAEKRLGEGRIKTAYAYKNLLNENGWLINGTDFPIESINPLYTFYAAVSRKDRKGWPEEGFQIENALSREEALKSITIWPARGSFDEQEKGSIEVGKWADFVMLDRDIMEISEQEIPSVKVLMNCIGGDTAFAQ